MERIIYGEKIWTPNMKIVYSKNIRKKEIKKESFIKRFLKLFSF